MKAINLIPPVGDGSPPKKPGKPRYSFVVDCKAPPEEQAKALQNVLRWLAGLS